MKKLQKMALVAFFGLLAVSFGSCTKDLEDRMDKVEKDVATLVTDVATLKTTLADLSGKVGKNVTDIADAQKRLSDLESKGGVSSADLAAAKADLEAKIKAAQDAVVVSSIVTNADGTVTMSYKEGGVAKTITYKPASATSKVTVVESDNFFTVTVDGTPYTFPKKVGSGESGITGLYYIPGNHDLHKMCQYMILGLSNDEKKVQDEMSFENGGALLEPELFATQKVNFRVNPLDSKIGEANFKIVSRTAAGISTRATGDSYTLYTAPSTPAAYGDGAFTFDFNVKSWNYTAEQMYENALKESGEFNLVALETKVGERVITSDYVVVYPELFTAHVTDQLDFGFNDEFVYTPIFETARDSAEVAYEINYNEIAEKIPNMYDIVEGVAARYAIGGRIHSDRGLKPLADYGFNNTKWKFTVVKYFGEDGVTDISSFMSVDADGTITVLRGAAAIERRPIVKAELLTLDGAVIARGYIKFEITNELKPVPVTIDGGKINYQGLFIKKYKASAAGDEYAENAKTIALTWDDMNKVYTQLGISHTQFVELYNDKPTFMSTADVLADKLEAKAAERLSVKLNEPLLSTYAIAYNVTPYAKFGPAKVTFRFTPKVASATYPVVDVTFTFDVVKPTLKKEILTPYKWAGDATGKTVVAKGQFVVVEKGTVITKKKDQYFMQIYCAEVFNHEETYQPSFDETHSKDSLIYGAKHQFLFNKKYAVTNVAQLKDVITGETVKSSTTGTLGTRAGLLKPILGDRHDKGTGVILSLVNKIATAERTYEMNFRTNYLNGEYDEFVYNVRFENPLAIVHTSDAKFSLVDNVNPVGLDAKNNYNVTFMGLAISTKGVLSRTESDTSIDAERLFPMVYWAFPAGKVTVDWQPYFYNLEVDTRPFQLKKTTDNWVTADNRIENSLLGWYNNDTKLQSRVLGGKLTFTFDTPFASITHEADDYHVDPMPAPAPLK